MNWLHEHGVISSYHDYVRLPGPVVMHARLWMAADVAHQKTEARKAADARKRAGRAGGRS